MEPSASSLNSGDVFVVVSEKYLFHWVGKGANVIEKARVSNLIGCFHNYTVTIAAAAMDVCTCIHECLQSSHTPPPTHTHTHTHSQGSDVVMRILHKKELGCHATTAVTLKEEDEKINQNTRKEVTFWDMLGGKKAVKGETRVALSCDPPVM